MVLIRLNAYLSYLDHCIKILKIEITQTTRQRAKHMLVLFYNRRCKMRDAIRNQRERIEDFLFMINVNDTISWTPTIIKGMHNVVNSFLSEHQTKIGDAINSIKTLDSDAKIIEITEDKDLADYMKTHPMPSAGAEPLPPPTAPTTPPGGYIRIPKPTPARV